MILARLCLSKRRSSLASRAARAYGALGRRPDAALGSPSVPVLGAPLLRLSTARRAHPYGNYSTCFYWRKCAARRPSFLNGTTFFSRHRVHTRETRNTRRAPNAREHRHTTLHGSRNQLPRCKDRPSGTDARRAEAAPTARGSLTPAAKTRVAGGRILPRAHFGTLRPTHPPPTMHSGWHQDTIHIHRRAVAAETSRRREGTSRHHAKQEIRGASRAKLSLSYTSNVPSSVSIFSSSCSSRCTPWCCCCTW